MSDSSLNVEEAVRKRYGRGAKTVEPGLCCPTAHNPKLLEAIPDEVLARDYGCGDPTRHLRPGDTVLDLGSGSGKICFLASQVVGPGGRVIGIDMNDDMLALARRHAPEVANRIGYVNVEFRKAKIQDLALDIERLDEWLKNHPVRAAEDLGRLEETLIKWRTDQPLVSSELIDVVVSNCVLNLVQPRDKRQLFAELFRVLRRGGRAVISDIVSDEDVPLILQQDPDLWSGCISGAFREDLFLEAFEQAGFYGVTILDRQVEPWRTVEGIEFRSMTVAAYKGKQGPCLDQKHAVVYRGPFRQVEDDDGHVLRRGVRTAVREKTFHIYNREPYKPHFEPIEPRTLVPLDEAPPFSCNGGALLRHPKKPRVKTTAQQRKQHRALAARTDPGVAAMATEHDNALRILGSPGSETAEFDAKLAEHRMFPLLRDDVKTLQINVGKLCNQACQHCHVDAGPHRTEVMPAHVAERVIELLAASPEIETVDITGGAPELNPNFRWLVEKSRRLGRHVIDRCNLTVLFEPGMEDLTDFLAAHQVEITASLPCYTEGNVDQQRGRGAFEKSIRALRILNGQGYGLPGSELPLNLVFNPLGPSLPPPQEKLEEEYKTHLREEFGVEFHRLFTLTNMPISRFGAFLRNTGKYDSYAELLANNFNANTVPGLMCRSLVSVGWDGKIYDCDFNQILEIPAAAGNSRYTIWNISGFNDWCGRAIATGGHCFGCTAGAGSSCLGSLQ